MDVELFTVVLEKQSGDINTRAAEIFERISLGAKTKGARGVLFLVDPAGRQVRMEIGYDLEGVFTDAFTGYVERDQMTPFFQSGRVGAGIEATTELLVARGLQARAFSADRDVAVGETAHLSGGGGARMGVEIGGGISARENNDPGRLFSAQSTPLGTLQSYREVVRNHIKDPHLEIYTPASRAFFANWLVTDAQQDNEGWKLDRILPQAIIVENGSRAVIRFPVADRHASPYFFQKNDSGWMLDFSAMNRVIRFNHKNQWHFVDRDHPYMFGFREWRFDQNGFPHPG
jgi:uncharacterized protein